MFLALAPKVELIITVKTGTQIILGVGKTCFSVNEVPASKADLGRLRARFGA